MLISLNWIKKFVDININNDELIKLIGARLVEVEEAIDQTHKYDKIYAVKVESCEKIEGTHLSLCKINDNGRAADVERDEDGFVQVMCGAPNVHAGMFAAWIAPGAIVPASVHDAEPFVIGMRRMLKKYDSYGMMAGADELDLGDDHSGIVELDPATTKAGDDFAKLFELDDIILDIENKSLTHRPDTFGIIGFAREVAGILGQKFQTPDWLLETKAAIENKGVKLEIEIVDNELCPRYTAVVLGAEGDHKKPYLTYEDTLLARSGMRPIDAIVDITNYIMLLTGQPLHAFDYDKFVAVGGIETPKIIVRAAKSGEKLTLLDGKEVELVESDIVITSNDIPVALAGAMGGANTEIDENTKRVILESATFSLYNLRKTQMAHGIFSEAITRFTKGQPAGQTLPVALYATKLLEEYMTPIAVFDSQKETPTVAPVVLSLTQLNSLLGTDFSAEQAKDILENVEFSIKLDGDNLIATAPYWRTDIHIPEDVIEEVGRLSGYDNISPVLPLHATSNVNEMFTLKTDIRNILSSYGANEVLTYSFVHSNLLQKVGQNLENSYRIVNSISPDLQYIRQSIVPSLLDKSYANLRAGYGKFALFECNQVYTKTAGFDEDGVPQNAHHLGFVFVNEKSDSSYYTAKLYLEKMLTKLGVNYNIEPFHVAKDSSNAYYESKRSANIVVNGQLLGYLGEIKQKILRDFKLPLGVAAFELDLSVLLKNLGIKAKDFRLSAYPSVLRDITISQPVDASFSELEKKIKAALEAKNLIYSLECSSIYHADGADTKNISFHIKFSDPAKTLSKDEIQAIMSTLESIN